MYSLNQLFLEITNRCLLSCIHCSSESIETSEKLLNYKTIKNIVDQGIELGLKQVTFSGGEPFLHPNIFQLIEYVKRKNLKLFIYSCGVIGNVNNYCSLDQETFMDLEKIGLDGLIYSIHGANKKTHDVITKVDGSFDLTRTSIKNTSNTKIPYEIHFVPIYNNYTQIDDVAKLCISLGASKLSVLRLVPQGRGTQLHQGRFEYSKQVIYLAEKIKKLKTCYPDLFIRLGAPFNCISNKTTPCTAAKNKILISPSGEVFPCESFKWMKGNRKTIYDNTLEYLWKYDELFKEIRNLSVNSIMTCDKCHFKESCQGGCPGQRMLLNQDMRLGPDYICLEYIKRRFELDGYKNI